MTILNNGTRNQYTATSGQTTFIYNFELFDQGDIVVYKNTVLLSIGTHYSVTGVGVATGGTIVLVTGATTGDTITIFRDTAAERLTDYQNSGDFLADEVNQDFDRLWAVVQEINTNQNRFLQTSEITEIPLPVTLEESVTGQILRWKDPNTIDSVSSSNITPTGSITTDYARHVTDYAALRLINTADYADGQVIVITNSGIGGEGVLRNVTAHGLTDNGGTIIVINADWYWQRNDTGFILPEWFEAVGDGVQSNLGVWSGTDDQQAFYKACRECQRVGRPLVLDGTKNYYRARVEVQKTFDVIGNGAGVWYLGLGVTYIGGNISGGSGSSTTYEAWPFNQYNDIAQTDPGLNDPDGDYNPIRYVIQANVAAGAETINVGNTDGLSPGDYVFIADQVSSFSSQYNLIPKVFEFARIVAKTSSAITLASPLKESYTTAGGVFFSAGLAVNSKISNLRLITTDDAYQYVIRSAYNCQLDNIEFAGKSAVGAATFCENLRYSNLMISSTYGAISQARGTVSAYFKDIEHRIQSVKPVAQVESNCLFLEESFYKIYVDSFNSNDSFFSMRQIDMSGVTTKRNVFVYRSTFDNRKSPFNDGSGAIQNGSTLGCDLTFRDCVIATLDETTPPAGNYPGITGDAHNWHATCLSTDNVLFYGCTFYSTSSTSANTAFKTGSGFVGTLVFDKYCKFITLSLDETYSEKGARTLLPTVALASRVDANTYYRYSPVNRTVTLAGGVILGATARGGTIAQVGAGLAPIASREFAVSTLETGGVTNDTAVIQVKTNGDIVYQGSPAAPYSVDLTGVWWDLA